MIPSRKVFGCAAPASGGPSEEECDGAASEGRPSKPFSRINPHAAGIDIGATHHVVAVALDRDSTPVRTFSTFSGDLHALADWLQAVGITTVPPDQRLRANR